MGINKTRKLQWRTTAVLLAFALLFVHVLGAKAFADNQIYPAASYLYKDGTYGASSASFWGSNYNQCCGQIIEAGEYTLQWDAPQANNLANDYANFGPVIHLFQYDPNNPGDNCAAPYTYTGAIDSNLPDYFIIDKPADCSGPFGSSYHNEVRVFTSTTNAPGMVGGTWYGGARFAINTGELATTNTWKVSNDMYAVHNSDYFEHKVNYATWCFNTYDMYGC